MCVIRLYLYVRNVRTDLLNQKKYFMLYKIINFAVVTIKYEYIYIFIHQASPLNFY